MISKRLLFLTVLLCSISPQVWSQDAPYHNIKASLDPLKNQIHVIQKISYTHLQELPTQEIYLNDWNNAYSSTESPLAKRLVEEYNRSFYLSKKSKRGATQIESLQVDGRTADWERPADQIDIIKVDLPEEISKGAVVKLKIDYTLQLPDAKFTGYGITDKEEYFLENLFLSVSWLSETGWAPFSHLDLEDIPNREGNYNIAFSLPERLTIMSNLSPYKTEKINDVLIYSFKDYHKKQLLFHIGAKNDYRHFSFDGKKVSANLRHNDLSEAGSRYSLKKINAFLNKTLGDFPHQNILLSQQKYEKRPFYGLTLIPSLLKPFPPQFEFEVKALNTYLYHYLNELLPLHPRDDYWLLGGLHTYLMMRYMLENYPDKI